MASGGNSNSNTNNNMRNIRNAARTGGRYALQGMRLAGIGTLTAAEIASRSVEEVARFSRSRSGRELLAGAGTIAATVAFAPAAISLTAINYLYQTCLLGRDYSAVQAIQNTFRATNQIMDATLGIVAEPVRDLAHGVSDLARRGRESLEDMQI